MTDTLDIARLEELEKRATPGPWYAHAEELRIASCPVKAGGVSIAAIWCRHSNGAVSEESFNEGRANAHLIAAARSALPALLARVRELEAALEPFSKAAKAIDDDPAWAVSPCPDDVPVNVMDEDSQPSIGDLRRAHALLSPKDQANGG